MGLLPVNLLGHQISRSVGKSGEKKKKFSPFGGYSHECVPDVVSSPNVEICWKLYGCIFKCIDLRHSVHVTVAATVAGHCVCAVCLLPW